MKRAIVTTTINPPTKAIEAFIQIAIRDDWKFFIVGDQRTPQDPYRDLENKYLSPYLQENAYPALSSLIGWNCIQRRNIGYLAAYEWGAEIIATIDDDNIPLKNWGQNIAVGNKKTAKHWVTDQKVFDPLQATNHRELWHRGFPLQLLPGRNKSFYEGKITRDVLVQADLWNGDPDIDAICRISRRPEVKFNHRPFFTNVIAPFNSQNTFLSRKVIPFYFLFPHIGRFDDIWAAYWLQHIFPDSVLFGEATVYQERNPHNLFNDLKAEMFGYEKTFDVIWNLERLLNYLPERSLLAYLEYRRLFEL